MITLLYQAMIPSNFGMFFQYLVTQTCLWRINRASAFSKTWTIYKYLQSYTRLLIGNFAEFLFCSISSLKIQGVTNCLAFNWSGNYSDYFDSLTQDSKSHNPPQNLSQFFFLKLLRLCWSGYDCQKSYIWTSTKSFLCEEIR